MGRRGPSPDGPKQIRARSRRRGRRQGDVLPVRRGRRRAAVLPRSGPNPRAETD